LILSRLDDFSNSIEWYFLQFYDLLVAGSDCLLNSGSEIPNSVAEIAFVFSARGTFVAGSLIVATVEIGPGRTIDGRSIARNALAAEVHASIIAIVTISTWNQIRAKGCSLRTIKVPPSGSLSIFDTALDK
jgi:hypothetical protein